MQCSPRNSFGWKLYLGSIEIMVYPAEHGWWWFRVVDPDLDTSWVAVDSGTNSVSISPKTMNGAGSWYLYLVNFKNFLSPVGSTSLAGLNVEQINKCLSRADCSLKGVRQR